jgi:glycerol-3-phosphate dehydrogenase
MPLHRDNALARVFDQRDPWDVIVVGGGATGVGTALDAASRGYRTVLLEQSDFGKATSSRSTKLAHGGVRYLRQGRLALVAEALRERAILRRNAPHLVRAVPFLVPVYRWWESTWYGAGLALYGCLSGPESFGRSCRLSRDEALERIPSLRGDRLRGGVLYYDGQFDDARLLINLAQTAAHHGAAMLNYVQVLRIIHGPGGLVRGVRARDSETGRECDILGRCVINATGAFCDALRAEDDPQAPNLVAPSQGAHIVLPRSFLGGDTAMMLPRTDDGRVLFAIPWHGHALVGTTDTPIARATLEPRPMIQEVDFLLDMAGRYLARQPRRSDVLSAFAGIRPLVRNGNPARTARLSREHLIDVAKSGLITITGGKWTTYRAMAQECVDVAIRVAGLTFKPCVTATLRILGESDEASIRLLADTDADCDRQLDADLGITAAHVRWAVRNEAARTVDDMLARRTRVLHLDARKAVRMGEAVAALMAEELGRDDSWAQREIEQFRKLALSYLLEDSGEVARPTHAVGAASSMT